MTQKKRCATVRLPRWMPGLLALAVTACFILAGCGKPGGSAGGKAAAPSARDLGGITVTLGQWYSDYDVRTFKPENEEAERTLAWRTKIQEDHRFTMRETIVGGWGEMQELTAASIMAGAPAASIFVLQPAWALTLYNQNLLYPVSDLPGVDLSSSEPVRWNPDVQEAFTFNGKVYAFAAGYGTGMGGVGLFFNKRLFMEAGIDPELPYDLQKSGGWTWDAFIDMCKQLNRDVNNDGIVDVYALASFSTDTLNAIAASNEARYVDKDPGTGALVNATGRPEFLQALQFGVRLADEGFLMPQPEGSQWNWFISAFHDGKAAMRAASWYVRSELQDMTDDWGYVAFPKGPRASGYRRSVVENVYVIPSTFSMEDADKILYALSLWLSPPPDADAGPDDWKDPEYRFYRDPRPVDETLPVFRDPKHNLFAYHFLIPGLSTGDIAYKMWGAPEERADPAQLIESVSLSWNSLINMANGSP